MRSVQNCVLPLQPRDHFVKRAVPFIGQPLFNDVVEGYDFGWLAGTVTEIGGGTNQGYYMIKYDKFSSSR